MSGRMNRQGYQQLVDEDIAWLKTVPRTLERDHILMILERAVGYEYDLPLNTADVDVLLRAAGFIESEAPDEDTELLATKVREIAIAGSTFETWRGRQSMPAGPVEQRRSQTAG